MTSLLVIARTNALHQENGVVDIQMTDKSIDDWEQEYSNINYEIGGGYHFIIKIEVPTDKYPDDFDMKKYMDCIFNTFTIKLKEFHVYNHMLPRKSQHLFKDSIKRENVINFFRSFALGSEIVVVI